LLGATSSWQSLLCSTMRRAQPTADQICRSEELLHGSQVDTHWPGCFERVSLSQCTATNSSGFSARALERSPTPKVTAQSTETQLSCSKSHASACSHVAGAKCLLQTPSSSCQLRAKVQLRQTGREIHSAMPTPSLSRSVEQISQISAPDRSARTPQH